MAGWQAGRLARGCEDSLPPPVKHTNILSQRLASKWVGAAQESRSTNSEGKFPSKFRGPDMCNPPQDGKTRNEGIVRTLFLSGRAVQCRPRQGRQVCNMHRCMRQRQHDIVNLRRVSSLIKTHASLAKKRYPPLSRAHTPIFVGIQPFSFQTPKLPIAIVRLRAKPRSAGRPRAAPPPPPPQ